ncbi:MAG: hypothetical protein DIU69_11725, partial [Bacillota bacterium]
FVGFVGSGVFIKGRGWAFAGFDSIIVARPGRPLAQARVAEGRRLTVPVVVRDVFGVTVPKNEARGVTWAVEVADPLAAPVVAGQPVGRLVVKRGDRELASTPVVADAASARAGPLLLGARLFGWTWPMR